MEGFDKITRAKAIGFLVWFRNEYGDCTNDTYYKMADKYGQCNYGTCRNLMFELEAAGYIKIWHKGLRSQKFCLDIEKYNELVNPAVFQKELLNI